MSAVTRAYDHLHERITSGLLPPGERLYEEEIAAATGVSRTPVREALRRLAGDGLITLEGKRGAHVVTWSADDLEIAFDLRCLLEPYAAARAATRIGDDALAHLRDLDERMHALAAAGAHREIAPLNNEFHLTVVAAAEADRLLTPVRQLIHVPLVPRTESYDAAATAIALAQHRDLVAALAAGDASRAGSIMQSHILHARAALLRVLGVGPGQTALAALLETA